MIIIGSSTEPHFSFSAQKTYRMSFSSTKALKVLHNTILTYLSGQASTTFFYYLSCSSCSSQTRPRSHNKPRAFPSPCFWSLFFFPICPTQMLLPSYQPWPCTWQLTALFCTFLALPWLFTYNIFIRRHTWILKTLENRVMLCSYLHSLECLYLWD